MRGERYAERAVDFRNYFLAKRIYLPRSLAEKIESLWESTIGDVNRFSLWQKHQPETGKERDVRNNAEAEAFSRFTDGIPPLRREIEDEFRALLGVSGIPGSEEVVTPGPSSEMTDGD